MVIDFHTHLFPDALAKRAQEKLMSGADYAFSAYHDMKAASAKKKMEEWGIDLDVVLPVVTKETQFMDVNTFMDSLDRDYFVPFGGIYPNSENWREQVDYVFSLGFKGIKFHAEFQDFDVDSQRMLGIYDYCFSKGLIVIHHAGADPAFRPPFRTSPKQFRHISEELKGGVLVVAHLGGYGQWDDVEEYLAGSDVYIDTSIGFEQYGVERFLRVYEKHGADRLLFATDSPWSNTPLELQTLRGLNIPEADKEKILCKNAKRLLGIE